MVSNCIPLVEKDRSSFFFVVSSIPWYIKPRFLYPVVNWWRFWSVPYLSCWELSCNEHRDTDNSFKCLCNLIWANFQMRWLGHKVDVFPDFWGFCILFSITAALVYIHTKCVLGYVFPQILTRIYFFEFDMVAILTRWAKTSLSFYLRFPDG